MAFQEVLNKVFTKSAVAQQVDKWKMAGEKVVFTNGCFDILHEGHVTYLAKSAEFGTKLVLGVNSDASVKRQGKGEDRPVNPEHSRAFLLAALAFVDAVVIFDEDTPERIIQEVQPSILVKGADYDANETDPTSKRYIVGRDAVISYGGNVKTVPLVEGFSTTAIIQKLKKV